MLKKLCLFVIVVLIVACKSDTKKSNLENTAAEKVVNLTKELSVVIFFKTDKTDDFKLMLNDIEVDEFQKMNIHIIEKIIPTTDYSEIEAKFGKNNFSENLVVSLGKNNEKLVEIKSIEVSFGQKSVYIDNNIDFKKYFAFNKYVEVSSSTNITIQTNKINGTINPVIYSKGSLNSLLNP